MLSLNQSRTKGFNPALLLLTGGLLLGLSSCATAPATKAALDTRTEADLNAMTTKLAAAKTLRIVGSRTAPPGRYAGLKVAEVASGTVTVQRPNVLVSKLKSKSGDRTIALAGGNVTLVDYAAGTHAVVKARGDIDDTLRSIEKTYGIMPPVAELLVNRPKEFLLDGVTAGRFVNEEKVDGLVCDHLSFTQTELTWDLWVATTDHLPRKLVVVYPRTDDREARTLTARISKWELDVPLSENELKAQIPAKSMAIDMIPLSE